MGLKPTRLDTDDAERLAGVTGLGWTTSTLGFLGSALGYGNSLVGRLASESQTLLYVGLVCFLATLGLDRIAGRATDSDEAGDADETSDTPETDAAGDVNDVSDGRDAGEEDRAASPA